MHYIYESLEMILLLSDMDPSTLEIGLEWKRRNRQYVSFYSCFSSLFTFILKLWRTGGATKLWSPEGSYLPLRDAMFALVFLYIPNDSMHLRPYLIIWRCFGTGVSSEHSFNWWNVHSQQLRGPPPEATSGCT